MWLPSIPDDSSIVARLSLYQWIVLVVAVYTFVSVFLYPFFLSPVRKIPGPWFARISKLPLLYATFKRRRTKYVTQLLDKYGPVVVIAPDQVHTTDDMAMKSIYDKTAIKTRFYSSMGSWKGVTSTLGFLDYSSAAPSRNNLIQCFQNRNLAALVENIQSHVHDFLHLLDTKVSTKDNVDGILVFRLLALDVLTDVLWAEQNRLLSDVNEEEASKFLRRFHSYTTWNSMKSFIPGAETVVRLFGTRKWRTLRRECSDMDLTAREALARWQISGESGEDHKRHEKDVLSMLLSMNTVTAGPISPEHVPAYMVEMLAAGSSTTSHTAAFVCFLLARNRIAQQHLHEELTTTYPDPESMDLSKMSDLPFLNGVIHETMRMYPMIPGPLERYLGKDTIMAGHCVPKGVIASTSAFNQGRQADVYPDPNMWTPERWFNATERMRLNWIPFGSGCRSCPGSNLAMTELKYMVGSIFRRFSSVVPEGHEEDTLEFGDAFAAGLVSGHCWLRFEQL